MTDQISDAEVEEGYQAAYRALKGTSADIGAGELDRIIRAALEAAAVARRAQPSAVSVDGEEIIRDGSIVECVDDFDTFGALKAGELYIVARVNGQYLTICPDKGGWGADRFRLVLPLNAAQEGK